MDNNYNSFYSNAGGVYCSDNDFIIRFARTAPSISDKPKSPIEKEILDLHISPKQFKKMLNAMKSQLDIYEKNYGGINLATKKRK
jgi:hypothetical protein